MTAEDRLFLGRASPDFAVGVGLVAMASVELELATAEVYANLLGSPLGYIVAMGQSFDANQQASLQLIKAGATSADLARRTTDTLAVGKDLYGQRNRVVHGYWMLPDLSDGSADETRQSYRIRRWAHQDVSRWTAREIKELANALSNTAAGLSALADEIRHAGQRQAG